MDFIQVIILGLVQGLTEFLPVSSSGHLVLVQQIFGIKESALVLDTFLHIGTLVAVFVYFWKDIAALIKKPFQKLTWLLVAATLPTIIIAVVFKDTFDMMFEHGGTLGYEFIITGLILLLAEKFNRGRKKLKETSYLDAVFIGIMQGISIAPAISRSGLTISGALFRNLDREFAAKFSLLLSIPSILGAVAFQTKDIMELGAGDLNLTAIAIGTLVSAIAGYISIKYMIEFLKRGKMKYFSYYVFIIGALVIIDQLVTHFYF